MNANMEKYNPSTLNGKLLKEILSMQPVKAGVKIVSPVSLEEFMKSKNMHALVNPIAYELLNNKHDHLSKDVVEALNTLFVFELKGRKFEVTSKRGGRPKKVVEDPMFHSDYQIGDYVHVRGTDVFGIINNLADNGTCTVEPLYNTAEHAILTDVHDLQPGWKPEYNIGDKVKYIINGHDYYGDIELINPATKQYFIDEHWMPGSMIRHRVVLPKPKPRPVTEEPKIVVNQPIAEEPKVKEPKVEIEPEIVVNPPVPVKTVTNNNNAYREIVSTLLNNLDASEILRSLIAAKLVTKHDAIKAAMKIADEDIAAEIVEEISVVM